MKNLTPELEAIFANDDLGQFCIFLRDKQPILRKIIAHESDMGSAIDEPIDLDGNTPLHLACKYGSLRIFGYLIRTGASLSKANIFGFYPIHEAIKLGIPDDLMEEIEGGKEAFLGSFLRRKKEIIHQIFLENRNQIDISSEISCGQTALHCAAQASDAYATQVLLGYSAKSYLQTTKPFLQTPLHIAIENGSTEVAEILIPFLANFPMPSVNKTMRINAPNSDTPFSAAQPDAPSFIDIPRLDSQPVEKTGLDLQDGKGMTHLLLAITHGNEQIVKLLLEHGASLTLQQDLEAIVFLSPAEQSAVYGFINNILLNRQLFTVKTSPGLQIEEVEKLKFYLDLMNGRGVGVPNVLPAAPQLYAQASAFSPQDKEIIRFAALSQDVRTGSKLTVAGAIERRDQLDDFCRNTQCLSEEQVKIIDVIKEKYNRFINEQLKDYRQQIINAMGKDGKNYLGIFTIFEDWRKGINSPGNGADDLTPLLIEILAGIPSINFADLILASEVFGNFVADVSPASILCIAMIDVNSVAKKVFFKNKVPSDSSLSLNAEEELRKLPNYKSYLQPLDEFIYSLLINNDISGEDQNEFTQGLDALLKQLIGPETLVGALCAKKIDELHHNPKRALISYQAFIAKHPCTEKAQSLLGNIRNLNKIIENQEKLLKGLQTPDRPDARVFIAAKEKIKKFLVEFNEINQKRADFAAIGGKMFANFTQLMSAVEENNKKLDTVINQIELDELAELYSTTFFKLLRDKEAVLSAVQGTEMIKTGDKANGLTALDVFGGTFLVTVDQRTTKEALLLAGIPEQLLGDEVRRYVILQGVLFQTFDRMRDEILARHPGEDDCSLNINFLIKGAQESFFKSLTQVDIEDIEHLLAGFNPYEVPEKYRVQVDALKNDAVEIAEGMKVFKTWLDNVARMPTEEDFPVGARLFLSVGCASYEFNKDLRELSKLLEDSKDQSSKELLAVLRDLREAKVVEGMTKVLDPKRKICLPILEVFLSVKEQMFSQGANETAMADQMARNLHCSQGSFAAKHPHQETEQEAHHCRQHSHQKIDQEAKANRAVQLKRVLSTIKNITVDEGSFANFTFLHNRRHKKLDLTSKDILDAIEAATEDDSMIKINMASTLLQNGALMKQLVANKSDIENNLARLVGIFINAYDNAQINRVNQFDNNFKMDIARVFSTRRRMFGINFGKRINGNDRLILKTLDMLRVMENQGVAKFIVVTLLEFKMSDETRGKLCEFQRHLASLGSTNGIDVALTIGSPAESERAYDMHEDSVSATAEVCHAPDSAQETASLEALCAHESLQKKHNSYVPELRPEAFAAEV